MIEHRWTFLFCTAKKSLWPTVDCNGLIMRGNRNQHKHIPLLRQPFPSLFIYYSDV